MAETSFYQGQLAVVKGFFHDPVTLDPVDPSVIKVTIVRPDGQRNEYTYGTDAQVTKDSIGRYRIQVAGDIPGSYVYWWHSTGTGKAADERSFTVLAAQGANASDQPESLQLSYRKILRELGRFQGWGRDPGSWETDNWTDATDIIRSGLSRFYWAPVIPTGDKTEPIIHSWSFLSKATTIDLVASQYEYQLPEDFGEMISTTFVHAAGVKEKPITLIPDERLRQLQAMSPATGVPKYAAVMQYDRSPTSYRVTFYPTPSAAYTLSYDYGVAPKTISDVNPYPLGGPQHSETILEAILAAAEKKLQDGETVHEQRFQELLARSVAADTNLGDSVEPWPVELEADGLEINKAYLRRLIGREMEYGPHPATWDHRKEQEVENVLQTGLRKFYAPDVLPGERYAHEWSFLLASDSIRTNSDTDTYDLPQGLVSLEGPLTFAPTTGMYDPVQIVKESQVRTRQQYSVAAGKPVIAAMRPKADSPSGGTLYEIVLYPQPDGEYELGYRYQVNPRSLPEDVTLPYGGQRHAQTIIEACLAAVEEQSGKPGIHSQRFMECLKSSISQDRRTSSPETLGINRDRSDRPGEMVDQWHDMDANLVYYNNTLY